MINICNLLTQAKRINEFCLPVLKEGEDYKRVHAENDQGHSEPLDFDKATKVKNPFGMLAQETERLLSYLYETQLLLTYGAEFC